MCVNRGTARYRCPIALAEPIPVRNSGEALVQTVTMLLTLVKTSR